jgi:hypothetical protein
VADNRSPEIPDLELPPQRTRSSAQLQAVTAPAPEPVRRSSAQLQAVTPPSSPAPSVRNQVAIDVGNNDDDFDMEIERGGNIVPQSGPRSAQMALDAPPRSTGSGLRPSAQMRSAGSGLEVSYKRLEPRAVVATGPSSGQRLAAWAIPIVLAGGGFAGSLKVLHRHGGRSVLAMLPHAFDATSTFQSGAFSLSALGVAIGLGFTGLKSQPRSYAFVGSAALLVLASLAMVTVTLVSLEEQPSPPDGALLIPYVVPFAVLLLGVGVIGRGPSLYLRGGARRGGAALAGLVGGTLVFLAIELSSFASRLP